MTSQTCPERMQGPYKRIEDIDSWIERPNGDRCCSFCGSLHPEDFLRLCEDASQPGSQVEVDVSDKNHKVYVHQPGVANADAGGIKFYKWHSIKPGSFDSDRASRAYTNAVHESWQRVLARASRSRFNIHSITTETSQKP